MCSIRAAERHRRGCWAAPEHRDVHHVVLWEDGDDTSLANPVSR
jgi:hypothetical protein